jgi:hypothetical protein
MSGEEAKRMRYYRLDRIVYKHLSCLNHMCHVHCRHGPMMTPDVACRVCPAAIALWHQVVDAICR